MPFLEHLEEFRRRLINSLIALLVGAVAGYFAAPYALAVITRPVPSLVYLAPAEAFVVRLKAALAVGLVLASPVIFYQLWRFVKPALSRDEASHFAVAVLSSSVFFLGGLAFAYFIIVPVGLGFFLSFETPSLRAMFSLDRYVTFVAQLLFASGVVFQLPVAAFFLTKLGIVNPRLLRKSRRVAVVVILVVAAVLTPPDVFTQVLLAVPLLLLYELSVVVSALAARKGRNKADKSS